MKSEAMAIMNRTTCYVCLFIYIEERPIRPERITAEYLLKMKVRVKIKTVEIFLHFQVK